MVRDRFTVFTLDSNSYINLNLRREANNKKFWQQMFEMIINIIDHKHKTIWRTIKTRLKKLVTDGSIGIWTYMYKEVILKVFIILYHYRR